MSDSLAVDKHTAVGELPWKRAREGLAFKLLRSCLESDTWAVIFRQASGSSVPPHIHQGHGEYFVIRGSIEFGKNADTVGVTALAGDYGVESSGAYHERTFFPVETEYLFIHHGAIHYFDSGGRVERVMNARTIGKLWEQAPPIGEGLA